MLKYRFFTFLMVILTVIFFLIAGCQKGSETGPLAPDTDPDFSTPGLTDGLSGDGERTQAAEPLSNTRHVWGLYRITIDPDTLMPEIVPLRGLEWHANVVEFLQPPFPPSNLGVVIDADASDLDNGLFAVDITLHHPFPSLPRFRGFDVRGGFLTDGSYVSKYDSSGVLAYPDSVTNEARLLNADGYMRWFNAQEFQLGGMPIFQYIPTLMGNNDNTSATLNPYKYFSDDFLHDSTNTLPLQEVNVDVGNRGTFSTSSSITRRYLIQFALVAGIPVLDFSYVVDASYFDPDENNPSYPVESFSTSANTQEAYKLVILDAGSTAYYVNSSSYGGNLSMALEIFDWQAPFNPSGVTGEIGSVIIESPSLLGNTGGMLDITSQFNANASPVGATSSVALIDIMDVTPSGLNDQYLFLTITSQDPSDYGNPWSQPYPVDPVLASYYLWTVPIINEIPFNNPPEVGQVEGPTPVDSTMGSLNYTVTVYDPDLGQNHTSMWSVVPTGNSANYNISGNPDLSGDIDWSGYLPDADYDVNAQVSDGIDQSEGTLLTVTHLNTPPTVGTVTGLDTVTVANDNENYAATINDPDIMQTLTVLWSVVPSGNSPNYIIPANGSNNSLDCDWSTFDVGLYDVNLQVDDGVAPPVEGTLLTVTLENTAPTLGAVTGDSNVDETDNASQYDHGTLTDPDNNQNHTWLWSLVIDGNSPVYNIAPNGANDSMVVDWCNYPPGLYDIQCQVYDGIDYGTSAVFNVTRVISSCSGTAHSYTGQATWTTYSSYPFSVVPRLDMTFYNGGNFSGQGVTQIGSMTLMNFVVTGTGAQSDPPLQYRYRIPSGDFVTSLDASPDIDMGDGNMDDRLVLLLDSHPDIIIVFDANVFMGGPLMVQLADVSGADQISCIAIDADDDIWALVGSGGDTVMLEHWTYIADDNTGGPYYTYESGDSLDVTSDIAWSAIVFDMEVAFTNNHLYILETGPAPERGLIHEIDLNTSPPTYEQSVGGPGNPIFSDLMSYDNITIGGTNAGADIVIDHVGYQNCDPEHCRIVVMGTLDTGSDYPTEMVRLDIELNILDSSQTPGTMYWPSIGMATNAGVGQRFLVGPGTDHWDVWDPPGDW